MTPDDIDKLTIAEVRAIAERAHDALTKFREVQSLMGGAATASTSKTSPSAADVASPAPNGHPTRVRTPLSDAEVAELAARRDALLIQNLPEELQRAERTPPP